MEREKVLIIDGLRHAERLNGYDRVYLGNEFCQNMIPTARDLGKQISFIKDKPFSFLSPMATCAGLIKLKKVFGFLKRNFPGCEVIVNDLGVMRMVSEYGCLKIVSGRLLSVFFFSQHNSLINKFRLKSILETYNIRRLEVGFSDFPKIKAMGMRLKISVYYPYKLLAFTRLCKIGLPEQSKGIFACKKECAGVISRLDSKLMPRKILVKGNAYFSKINPAGLTDKIISRQVFQPLLGKDSDI